MMGVFYHEETTNPSKRCRFLTATLKEAFCHCHTFNERVSISSPVREHPTGDFDDVVVSEIKSRAMERLKKKPSFMADSLTWVFSSSAGELYITPKAVQHKEDDDDEIRDFFSVKSCFSRCSSAANREEFFSGKSNFSRCSSLNKLDFQDCPRFNFADHQRWSMIQGFSHCEGWPFGLCRKAVLLPPLPKSPSESWSWRKGTKIVKLPYI
ncbi:hypothetical protein CFOL_v3_32065 [Cephalotus follicularis]|uniref:Uncharacterized protein n=1 Tax=Cephalotus follicularis TaxID=3775 RepID=A0A1Q3D8J8_CEPFO|nr:hypothetical protein CFOL_v3_32065 [Cephalotus follicularis]